MQNMADRPLPVHSVGRNDSFDCETGRKANFSFVKVTGPSDAQTPKLIVKRNFRNTINVQVMHRATKLRIVIGILVCTIIATALFIGIFVSKKVFNSYLGKPN